MIDSFSACLAAFLAGSLRVASPDHWMPVSLIAWRRDWGFFKVQAMTLVTGAMSLGLGYALYRLVFWGTGAEGSTDLLNAVFTREAGALILLIAVLRLLLFRRRVGPVLWQWPVERSFVATVAMVLSFLGPAELFAVALAFPEPRIAFYFAFGSLVAQGLYSCVGARLWDRPLGVSRGLSAASGAGAWVPLAFAALVGWFTLR